MQHHHAHLPRPTHMPNAHPMHQQTTSAVPPPQPPARITINLGPPQQQQQLPQQSQPPQQQQIATSHPPQQQQPHQQSHHMNNVVNGSTITLQQSANTQPHHHHHQQQHQQHQLQAQKSNYIPPLPNRLNHHHHPRQQPQQQHQQNHLIQTQQQQQRGNPQAIHTTQMQKIRQQHQLVNNSNNKASNGNNNQQHHQQQNQQPPQQHPQQQQQQQQLPQQQQQQKHNSQQSQTQHQQRHIHQPPTQNHVQQHQQQQQQQQQAVHNIQPISVIQPPPPTQQHQQPHPSASNTTTAAVAKQQQNQQNYAGGNANIYSNNNNNDSINAAAAAAVVVPKTILQNPNRSKNNNKRHNVILITPSDTSTDAAGASAVATNSLNPTNAKTSVTSTRTTITAANMITKNNSTETTISNTTLTISTSTTPIVSAKSATTTTTTATILSRNPKGSKENSGIQKIAAADSQEDKENAAPSTSLDDRDESFGENATAIASTVESSSSSGCASKEKTPMCLVNELARFNKITHQYRLTSEKGPAHCKRFTVTLVLGDEEYSAEGYKIKKAQHMAAAETLEKTKYEHPAPKVTRRCEEGGNSRSTITPTVELNALAMKLGQPTYYLFDPRQQPHPDAVLPPPPGPDLMYGPPRPHVRPPLPPPPPHLLEVNPFLRRQPGQFQRFNYYHRGPGAYLQQNKFIRYPLIPPVQPPPHHHHPHSGYPPPPPPPPPPVAPCKITLIVGKQKFVGIGRTLQSAKHDAASHALQVIRTQAADQLNEMLNRSMEESDSKSPISLVHEIGIKRNMTVHFKVLREEGPAHMKNFITACIAGNIVTEGCGNGKKISKKRAAEKMLEELKKLPPLSPLKSPIKRIKMKPPTTKLVAVSGAAFSGERKKRAGGAGGGGASDKAGEGDNNSSNEEDHVSPISKLIVLLQARKESDPVYELISKNGNEATRRREFIMEVRAAGNVARGRGNNMKMAKSNAAQNLLEILKNEKTTAKEVTGLESQQTVEPVDTKNASVTDSVVDQEGGETKGSSLSPLKATATSTYSSANGQVPGILILRQHKKNNSNRNSLKHHAAIVTPSSSSSTTTTQTTTAAITTKYDSTLMQAQKNANSLTTVSMTLTTASPAEVSAAAADTEAATSLKSKNSESTEEALNSTLDASNTSQTSDASSSADTQSSTTAATNSCSSGGRMKKQLLYLAQILGFEVEFSDYPKGNHNAFLTIVTLSTTPEQICHGTGATSEESQNDAAKNALKILSELDINRIKAN